jgi:hypothetical protein
MRTGVRVILVAKVHVIVSVFFEHDFMGFGLWPAEFRVAADFMLNLIAYNLIRIPKLVAA